jgi:hypothetical protein
MPSIAFGNIGGDGNGRAVQLVGQKAVATGELFGNAANAVGVGNGFLINDKFYKHERHNCPRIES